MKRQKILSVLLALFLAVLLLPGRAEAAQPASGTCGENLTWTLQNGTLTISGTGAMADMIPLSAPWYERMDQVEHLVLEPGVTTIGRFAFYDCIYLTSVIIPEGLTEIGENAFYGCFELEQVTIPGSVTTIGEGAFLECTSLREVQISEGVETIESYAFSGCTSLTSIDLPESVTDLGINAFFGCSSLQDVHLPDGLTVLQNHVFANCSSLTEIQIPAGIMELGAGVFAQCTGLRDIQIPAGVTVLGDEVFYGCTGLTEILIPESVNTIGEYAFSGCTGLTEITVPVGVTVLNAYIFADCTNLKTVNLPEGLTKICTMAFGSCTSLTEILIPEGVTRLETDAFYFCTGLTTVHLPVTLKGIGNRNFLYATDLTDVYYAGTQEQWQDVSINMYNDPLTRANFHFAPNASFKGATLSLSGIIRVNFYAQLNPELVPHAKVVFDVLGQVQEVPISEATLKDGLYVFSCEVAAKQMADQIVAQIDVDGEPVGKSATYSVVQYCKNKLDNEKTSEKLRNLLVAMLNYGTAAQNYFNYHLETPANETLYDEQREMKPVNPEDLAAFDMVITGTDEGIAKSGASLLLEADTIVRYRVQLKEGYAIEDYTFQYGDQVLTPVAAGDQIYYVDIPGIAAKDLDEMYPITVGGLSIQYGPMSYVLRQLDKEKNREVVTALYHYNQMANLYFA